ncbi:MAG: hypothetical protein J1E37_05855 [Prevotella sp.]|nr:hypothetical protein [Prevotella sp.]
MLHLSPLQRRQLRGRWTKRFVKENGNNQKELRAQFPQLYGGTWRDICLYEVGKLAGFLKND